MKIIHCSDIHLDSPMDANLTRQQARQRNNEICGTFGRMAAYARENQVRLVLIAGDLFDSQRISAKTADYLLSQIRQTPDTDFLYLRGNHDESQRAFLGRTLPQNLKLFSDTWQSYSYDFVTVTGIEPGEPIEFYSSLRLDSRQTNLVMLHGQVANRPGEELVCLPMLRNQHIDYLALGHLHSYQTMQLEPGVMACYCGCLEGRGFDECGAKGFVVLDVKPHQVAHQFVPFAARTLHNVEVDLTGLATVAEILQAAGEAGQEIPAQDLVKFTLTGSYTLDTQKDLEFLQQNLEPRYYAVKLKDESKLALDPGSYRSDASLKGELIRQVMKSQFPQQEKEQMIGAAIQALRGEEITL